MNPRDIIWAEVAAMIERIKAAPLPDVSQPHEYREALAEHLGAVLQFLMSVAPESLGRDGLKGFAMLRSALADMNNGTVHGFLRPKSIFQNRHPAPTSRTMLQWAAVREMDVLMKAGMTEAAAGTAIADVLHKLNFPSNAGYELSATTMINWRKKIRKDSSYAEYRDQAFAEAFDGRPSADVIKPSLERFETVLGIALRDGYGG